MHAINSSSGLWTGFQRYHSAQHIQQCIVHHHCIFIDLNLNNLISMKIGYEQWRKRRILLNILEKSALRFWSNREESSNFLCAYITHFILLYFYYIFISLSLSLCIFFYYSSWSTNRQHKQSILFFFSEKNIEKYKILCCLWISMKNEKERERENQREESIYLLFLLLLL